MGLASFLLMALLAVPQTLLQVAPKAFRVEVRGSSEQMRTCVQQGLELRYQFLMQVCKERSWWFDRCQRERKAIATLYFDPITGAFEVERDLYDDGKAPNQRSFAAIDEAFTFAAQSMPMTGEFLRADKGNVLKYRALAYCVQGYNQTLDRLAQAFSLGLVSFERYDSGGQSVSLLAAEDVEEAVE